MARVRPVMDALGQDVEAARQFILAGLAKALEPVSDTRLCFDFLASPVRILGDASGRVCGLEVEDTTLSGNAEDPKAKGLGTRRVVEVDTVVFCIGDKVDENFGLPVQWNAYVKNPNPMFPVGSLVVKNPKGEMVGFVTERDIMKGMRRQGCSLKDAKVSDIMITEPVVATPEDTIDYARDAMTKARISHLPVLEGNKLVGVISFYDAAKACLREANFENSLLKRYIKNWPEQES